ncbi:uracil-DNA glycosylase-like protein [Kalaharituber pfeilii]|nr:uracil-DNA glycosylase-like protein [Kalaharituber pfeilii]
MPRVSRIHPWSSLYLLASSPAAFLTLSPISPYHLSGFFLLTNPVQLAAKTMSTKRKAPPSNDTPNKARAITSFFTSAGGGSSASNDPPKTNFDKSSWVASLNEEQKRLLKLEIDTMDVSWLAELKAVLVAEQFLALKRFLEEEKKGGQVIFPPENDIYSWSRHCPFYKVKVVVLGQDPYHGKNQAHGLSFSVRPPTPAPPSLVNMFVCLKNDYPNFEAPPNKGGLLTPWAEQGVLLLNSALTVRQAQANSHANKGWEVLTAKCIELVSQKRTKGVVFMAWGRHAQDRCRIVDKKRHLVLQSVHPSPLSAHRGFMDCGHFKKANEFLETRYGVEGAIDWNLGKTPAGNPNVAAKVVEVVPKSEVGTPDVKVKDNNPLDEATKSAIEEENKKAEEEKKEETDYGSDGLDGVL